jgi:hypothetical protein
MISIMVGIGVFCLVCCWWTRCVVRVLFGALGLPDVDITPSTRVSDNTSTLGCGVFSTVGGGIASTLDGWLVYIACSFLLLPFDESYIGLKSGALFGGGLVGMLRPELGCCPLIW